MSATCIGELVRKMGERVLHKILPILQVRLPVLDRLYNIIALASVCWNSCTVLSSRS